jgi:two-component system KDP operon response regulator KdpE
LSSSEPLVLVVEDDPQVRRFLRTTLPTGGYRVVEAVTAAEASSLALQYVPDVVLLDLGLPDADGVDVIRKIRAWSSLPIIVVSARELERHKIEALDAGADDYLTKPFGFGELLARLRVALRHAANRTADPETIFRAGPLEVDPESRIARVDGDEVHLTPLEYKLLLVLIRHAGRVVTHGQLLRAVWGPHSDEHKEYVRIHMMRLRRKLGKRLFVTEPGVGYRLTE